MSERLKPPLQKSNYVDVGSGDLYPTAAYIEEGYGLDTHEVENLRRSLQIARSEIEDAKLDAAEKWQQLTGDMLTGCYTRWYFERRKKEILEEITDPVGKVAIIYFDLNGFKDINDRFGHPMGDKLLTQFGNFLNRNFRDDDMAFRIGGDEFAVICRQVDYDDSDTVGESEDQLLTRRSDRFPASFQDALTAKISEIQHSKIRCPAGEVDVTFSWGVAVLREGEGLNDTEARADHQMYEHKKRANRIRRSRSIINLLLRHR